MKVLRFARSARRHRIGKTHVHHVLATIEPTVEHDPATTHPILAWVGKDTRGRELEIAAVELDDCFLIIHVMPTALRKKGHRDV